MAKEFKNKEYDFQPEEFKELPKYDAWIKLGTNLHKVGTYHHPVPEYIPPEPEMPEEVNFFRKGWINYA